MKRILMTASIVTALAAGGVAVADARPVEGKAQGQAKKCAKPKKVGFVLRGTFVAADATSVTLKVTKASRHARKSGLVTVGESYTATPKDASKIRYVGRTGASDAQPTDKVKVVGKVTRLRKGCTDASFTPTATVRKVVVKKG
jgi:hypothetical protein